MIFSNLNKKNKIGAQKTKLFFFPKWSSIDNVCNIRGKKSPIAYILWTGITMYLQYVQIHVCLSYIQVVKVVINQPI